MLTKEQAEWLIEKLNKTPVETIKYNGGDLVLKYFESDSVLKIINQCTEKPFPELKLDTACNSQVNIGKRDLDNDIMHINIPNEYAYFTPEEFREFVAGCNEVMEWIDANK